MLEKESYFFTVIILLAFVMILLMLQGGFKKKNIYIFGSLLIVLILLGIWNRIPVPLDKFINDDIICSVEHNSKIIQPEGKIEAEILQEIKQLKIKDSIIYHDFRYATDCLHAYAIKFDEEEIEYIYLDENDPGNCFVKLTDDDNRYQITTSTSTLVEILNTLFN